MDYSQLSDFQRAAASWALVTEILEEMMKTTPPSLRLTPLQWIRRARRFVEGKHELARLQDRAEFVNKKTGGR